MKLIACSLGVLIKTHVATDWPSSIWYNNFKRLEAMRLEKNSTRHRTNSLETTDWTHCICKTKPLLAIIPLMREYHQFPELWTPFQPCPVKSEGNLIHSKKGNEVNEITGYSNSFFWSFFVGYILLLFLNIRLSILFSYDIVKRRRTTTAI